MDRCNLNITRKQFIRKIAFLSGAVLTFSLTSCRDSDSLYNTIYADWAEEIDYDSSMKIFNNVANAEPTTELPKIYDTDEKETDTEMTKAVYDEQSESTDDEQASKTEHNKSAESDQDESEGNSDKRDDNSTDEEGTDSEAENNDESSDSGEEGTDSGDADDEEEGDSEAGESIEENEENTNASKDKTSSFDAAGCFMAFGETANMVLMLGGASALWCCDGEFYNAAKKLYTSEDLTSIVVKDDDGDYYWETYRGGGTKMSSKKFKSLCSALDDTDSNDRPKQVIYDYAIGCPFTSKQIATLEDDYGIDVSKGGHSLMRPDYIDNLLKKIHKALNKAGLDTKYNTYTNFVNDLLNEFTPAAYNSSNKRAYLNYYDGSSTYSSSKVVSSEEDGLRWTLVINAWDDDIEYTAKNCVSATPKSTEGLALATLGCKWSPINYYLQCAGVLNNAAARTQLVQASSDSVRRYVWQFDTHYNGVNSSDYSSNIKEAYKLLSWKDSNARADLLMRAQSGACGLGKSGSGYFPAVIVTDSDYESKLESSMKQSSGVYAAYYLAADDSHDVNSEDEIGILIKQSGYTDWQSYVGYEDDDVNGDYQNTNEPFDVYLNPHGYYSNWVSGSVESFLEAAWAREKFVDSSYDAAGTVKDFYNTFYGSGSGDYASKVLDATYTD